MLIMGFWVVGFAGVKVGFLFGSLVFGVGDEGSVLSQWVCKAIFRVGL